MESDPRQSTDKDHWSCNGSFLFQDFYGTEFPDYEKLYKSITKCSRNFCQILIQGYFSLIFILSFLVSFSGGALGCQYVWCGWVMFMSMSMLILAVVYLGVQNSFSLKLQMHKIQTSCNSTSDKLCSWFTVIWQWVMSWESKSIMLEVLPNDSRPHYHEVKRHKCQKKLSLGFILYDPHRYFTFLLKQKWRHFFPACK